MTRRGRLSAMQTYRVETPANVQDVGPLGERYDLTFEPGEHVPKNENEEHALETLVRHGHASRVSRAKPKVGG